MAATSLNDEKEIFNQYKFCKELQNCSTEKTSQISILPQKTRSVPDYSLVLGLVHVRLRPYCREFLESVSQFYEVILFSSATKDYTDKLMDILDPQRQIIKHRLYRKHCTCVKGNYIRELRVLGRNLARTVFVDRSSEGFADQNANAILIKSWFKNPRDQELCKLVPFLKKLAELDDVRPVIQRTCQPREAKTGGLAFEGKVDSNKTSGLVPLN
ncbi:CTD small phosphatase-like protein 2-B [Narcine bancroftii]|uniref:CTD small phosphatase-like protein 2-B n=1 Tax=Narcine bancroftii TaxID=1343680 RepID=UPI003831D21B